MREERKADRVAGNLAARHVVPQRCYPLGPERESFIDSPLVGIHFVIEMSGWTGLAPWEFDR